MEKKLQVKYKQILCTLAEINVQPNINLQSVEGRNRNWTLERMMLPMFDLNYTVHN